MGTDKFKADFYSKIVKHIVAPLWAHRERSSYLRHLKYLKRSQYRPIEEVRADQWIRFKKLLNHAYNNTLYYAEKMRSCEISPDDIKSFDDLHKLPLLTKDDIRANRDKMIAVNMPRKKLILQKTSGSTGVSLEFYVDDDSLQWKRAVTIQCEKWTGWDIGERIAAIWGHPAYRQNWRGYVRNFFLERCIYLDTLKMDENDMLNFYYQIKKKKPTLLYGHAHSLYLFAQFLESEKLTGIRPKGIISTAMVLHGFEREKIEKIFECKIFDRYGCEEVSLIAAECRQHNGLHINMDTLIVEFIRDGKTVQAGKPGAIIVTDLSNYGMPFIRYAIEDVGILSSKGCSCGSSYPLIDSVEGRVSDYILTPEGKLISGISLTENFAMLLKGIKQLQIIQEKIDYLVFRIVKGDNFTEATERRIADLVQERFGREMKYSLEFVERISPERSGKYRFCISKINKSS